MRTVTQAIAKGARWAAATLMVAILTYVAAALSLGSIAANAGWTPPADAITVFVENNGIHTDIVVPKRAAGIDLSWFAPARDLVDPRYAGHRWLAIGWGERGFFLETPRWRDVRPATLLHAAIGSDRTLLHVEHVARPVPASDVRAIRLRPSEYRRLVAYMIATRRERRPAARGYDADDVFYPARGHYDAARTCNAWTGAALRFAGVRVGRWTPLPITVMGWFDAGDRETNITTKGF